MNEDFDTSSPEASTKRNWRRWIVRRMISVAVLYAAYCALLFVSQATIIFPAYIPNGRDALVIDLQAFDVHELTVTLDDGETVPAMFFPVAPTEPNVPQPTVIFFHGNAELATDQLHFVQAYRQRGFSVLVPEYRGYGPAGGSPSQAGIVTDMVAFYDLLIERRDVDANRIIFHGRSLGGGTAAQVALHRKPVALILQSTFSSVASMSSRYLVPSFLCRHPFRTDHVLQQLTDVPTLIFHGTNDRVIPVSHGRMLSDLAPHATYIEYDTGHDDLPSPERSRDYWDAITELIAK